VAILDMTAKTGAISSVFPVHRTEPQRQRTGDAELRVLDGGGRLLSRTPVAIRLMSDTPPKAHQGALIDASVPVSKGMVSLQLVVHKRVLDTFTSSLRKPGAPKDVKIGGPPPGQKAAPGVPNNRMRWTSSPGKGGPIFYTVEMLGERERWEAIGIGLTEPALRLTPEQTRAMLRITATNGFVNSEPLIVRGR
jgi:hypothetical protein